MVGLLPVGPDAVLVELSGSEEAVGLAIWARERRLARDVVPGARTVLLDGLSDDLRERTTRRASLEEVLAQWVPTRREPGPLVEVRVAYDGPDLADVAAYWGCAPDEVATRHQNTEFVSAFCGFAPGFAYLAGLDAEVPRLATPRRKVPAGAVALADRWCGVYPTASPGGWRIIGHTDLRLWNADREEPALLAPGTRVRFVAR